MLQNLEKKLRGGIGYNSNNYANNAASLCKFFATFYGRIYFILFYMCRRFNGDRRRGR